MKKILELTDQRVKSLEKIAESVTDVINNVQNAKDSHESAASVNTVVDLAKQWHQVEVQDAIEKGKKLGYSEACRDISVIMNQILEAVSAERSHLQALMEEVVAAQDVSDPEVKGESSDPLT